MIQSESIAKLAHALVQAQHDLPAIAKGSTNPHFKSKFASLDDIIDTVRPVLAKHRLGVLQGATLADDGKALLVETRLVHESGEFCTATVIIPIAKMDPQGAGSALTYGRRYGLSALLCLATEEDDDGNRANAPRPARREAAPRNAPSGADAVGDTVDPHSQPEPKKPADMKMPPWAPNIATRGKRLGDCSVVDLNATAAFCKKPENRDKPGAVALLKAVQLVCTDKALGPAMTHEADAPFAADEMPAAIAR